MHACREMLICYGWTLILYFSNSDILVYVSLLFETVSIRKSSLYLKGFHSYAKLCLSLTLKALIGNFRRKNAGELIFPRLAVLSCSK